MSANPRKPDAWRPYANVRFVLIRNPGYVKPSCGLICESRGWEALAVWRDDAALKPVVDWLRLEQLIRVPVGPN